MNVSTPRKYFFVFVHAFMQYACICKYDSVRDPTVVQLSVSSFGH